MPDKVRWGVLGAARIAVKKVIPAMQQARHAEVLAIASRRPETARGAAAALGVPRAYGSYDELLADPDVEAVYVPLPNHLHVPWSIRAAERGKHVLCEKPIGLDAQEARTLLAARDRTGRRIGEAFVVRVHPQWDEVERLVRGGRIGEVRDVSGHFSYLNDDTENVRWVKAYGGGALMDLGCYLVNVSRRIFGREPARVLGAMERDAATGVDVFMSMLLDFAPGRATGACGMRTARHQRVVIHGAEKRIDVEVPFGPPPDTPVWLRVDDGNDVLGANAETIEIPACNQFTLQADRFSLAIRGEGDVPCPLEDSVANMRVIDALARSAESGKWEAP
jgi:predicted dehydrogenase